MINWPFKDLTMISRFDMTLLVTTISITPITIIAPIVMERSSISTLFLTYIRCKWSTILTFRVEFICPWIHRRAISHIQCSWIIDSTCIDITSFSKVSYCLWVTPKLYSYPICYTLWWELVLLILAYPSFFYSTIHITSISTLLVTVITSFLHQSVHIPLPIHHIWIIVPLAISTPIVTVVH